MGLNTPKSGFHLTSEYQTAGLPFVTSSVALTTPSRIDFPKVTRAFTVRNLAGGGNLCVGFTAAGVTGSNRFEIPISGSERFELRIRTLFLQSTVGNVNFSLMAEETLIDRDQMPTLTGSNDGSPGALWQGIG